MKLFLEDAPDNLILYLQSQLADFPESVEISSITYLNDDSPRSRWEQLVLAGEGARLYSNTANKSTPLYAGKLPVDGADVDRLLVDLNFAYKQAKYIQSFGVTYIGRTILTPRTILIMDHKKVNERIDVNLPEALEWILRDAPDDWWGTMAVASTGNVDKLERLLNAIPDVIPMVLSTGSAAKVKFCGFDYVHLNEPKPGPLNWRYGEQIRGMANDLSRRLAEAETGDWEEPENGTVYMPDRSNVVFDPTEP